MRRLALALWNAHRRHPAQALLMLSGLALSVAVVVAIDLAIAGARDAFAQTRQTLSGTATHVVRANAGPLPDTLLAPLAASADVRAAPVIERGVLLRDGTRVRMLGIDPLAEAVLRPWSARALSTSPGGGDAASAFSLLLGDPDAAAVTASLAARVGLESGQRLSLRHGGRWHSLRVVAVLPADIVPASAGDLVLMDIAAAQGVADMAGRLDRIELVAADSDIAPLAAKLPDGVVVEPSGVRSAAWLGMSDAFEVNLRALSLLALLVGAFLVFQTLGFLTLRRRALIGLWRAIGVSRRELRRLLLLEALAVGASSGVIGMAIGTALAHALLGLVARTYSDLYFAVEQARVVMSPWVLGKAALLSVGAALLAVAMPLRAALRVPPLGNLRRLPLEQATLAGLRRASVPALASITAAGALLWLAPPRLDLAFVALFALLAATLGLLPLAAWGLLRVADAAVRERAAPLRWLVASLRLSMSRIGVALSALTLAIATLIGMSTMIHSFRAAVAGWVDDSLRADVFVSAQAPATLDDAFARTVSALDGVDAVSRTRRRPLLAADGPLTVIGVDLPRAGFAGYAWVDPVDDDDRDAQHERIRCAFDAGGALVSEPLARRLRLAPGDVLALPTPAGARTVEVIAVYRDYASSQGAVALALPRYRALYADDALDALGVYARGDAQALAETLRARTAGDPALAVVTAREIRERTLEVFARTFAVTDVLRVLAAVIAVVAVLGALLAIQHERTRELALLRALGLRAATMARLQLAQAGIVGALAGAFAVPLGIALAVALIDVVNRRSFGWSMALVLPWGQIAFAVALAVASALLAGWWPSRRLRAMPLTRALRERVG